MWYHLLLWGNRGGFVGRRGACRISNTEPDVAKRTFFQIGESYVRNPMILRRAPIQLILASQVSLWAVNDATNRACPLHSVEKTDNPIARGIKGKEVGEAFNAWEWTKFLQYRYIPFNYFNHQDCSNFVARPPESGRSHRFVRMCWWSPTSCNKWHSWSAPPFSFRSCLELFTLLAKLILLHWLALTIGSWMPYGPFALPPVFSASRIHYFKDTLLMSLTLPCLSHSAKSVL